MGRGVVLSSSQIANRVLNQTIRAPEFQWTPTSTLSCWWYAVLSLHSARDRNLVREDQLLGIIHEWTDAWIGKPATYSQHRTWVFHVDNLYRYRWIVRYCAIVYLWGIENATKDPNPIDGMINADVRWTSIDRAISYNVIMKQCILIIRNDNSTRHH